VREAVGTIEASTASFLQEPRTWSAGFGAEGEKPLTMGSFSSIFAGGGGAAARFNAFDEILTDGVFFFPFTAPPSSASFAALINLFPLGIFVEYCITPLK
jgi:hypothetical protein